MEKKSIVSAFSGIEGFGLGFVEHFNIRLSVEFDQHAVNILRDNSHVFGENHEIWHRDIYSIPDEEILQFRGVEGFVSGPPCQPFSPSGHFRLEDSRTKGLSEYVRWVRLIEPSFFVFENSFGLLQGNKKMIFDFFLKQLQSLGYHVHHSVMNAHEHGNVQTRRRVIAIGFRTPTPYSFPTPTLERKLVKDILTKEGEEVGPVASTSEKRADIMKLVPEGGNWRNLPLEVQKIAMGANFEKREGGMTNAYRRLDRYKPAPTFTTSPGQRNTFLYHPTEERLLSVKEYARGQGFPDDFVLNGSTAALYRALGNAVPVELSRAICVSIVDILEKSNKLAC